MITIPIKTRVGHDGAIDVTVQAPPALYDKQIDALLVVQPLEANEVTLSEKEWHDKLMSFSGKINDETFKRWPQGEYEVREEL
ncbi:MAG: hypothetical protein ABJA67_08420 [Chthonomonadales bacterium]